MAPSRTRSGSSDQGSSDFERPVRIRERRFAESLGYWTEDDHPEWFELFERPNTFWSGRSKSELPWSEEPDRVLDGAIQRFEGGAMLFLPRSDADRAILVLIGTGSDWRELPDQARYHPAGRSALAGV
jgi:hypothetical protein